MFYDEDDDERLLETETVYPISKLKKFKITPPAGFTYFKLLPVDYNRYGMNDIGIAYFTAEGKKYYAERITGDY